MNCLIVEDDFVARRLMKKWLSGIGDCVIVVNGVEAVDAFKEALDKGHPYDLICLDVMMPEMNGHQTLKAIRQIESDREIAGLDGVKVIMTTACGDSKHIMGAFKEGCEAYLIKPIKKQELFAEIEKLGLIDAAV